MGRAADGSSGLQPGCGYLGLLLQLLALVRTRNGLLLIMQLLGDGVSTIRGNSCEWTSCGEKMGPAGDQHSRLREASRHNLQLLPALLYRLEKALDVGNLLEEFLQGLRTTQVRALASGAATHHRQQADAVARGMEVESGEM